MYTTILKQPVAGFFLTVRRRRNSLLGLLAISFAAWSGSRNRIAPIYLSARSLWPGCRGHAAEADCEKQQVAAH